MRLLPLALLLATVASAQTSDLAGLDRRIADLDREIARLDADLDGVHRDLDGVRDTEADLDAERVRFQDAIRAYQRDAEAHRLDAERVRATYDDLVRYGGSDAEYRAYDRDRFRLSDASERLRGEAAMLNEWNADLNAGYRGHADRVRDSAGRGQRMAERRADLRHERWVLAQRRARLAARRR